MFKYSFFATSLLHVLSAIKFEMTDCNDDDGRCLYTLYNFVNVHFLASSKNMNLKHVSSFYFFVEGRNAIKRMNNDLAMFQFFNVSSPPHHPLICITLLYIPSSLSLS